MSLQFFPHGYNKPTSYLHDSADVPDLCFFTSFNDSKAIREEKEAFVRELRESGAGWDFRHELAKYCALDVKLLTEASCSFLKQSLLFQQQLILDEVKRTRPDLDEEQRNLALVPKTSYLNPFSTPFMTLSSFVYGMFRRFALPSYDICAIKDEMGLNAIPTSRAEQEVALYLKDFYWQFDVQSAFTSKFPPKFGRIKPDVYLVGTVNKKIFNVHGCHTHIHKSSSCTAKNMEWARSCDNPVNFFGESYYRLRNREERHINILVDKYGFQRDNIHTIWTCQWERYKHAEWKTFTNDKEMKWAVFVRDFMEKFDKKHPPKRLAPREALRGGKTEAYMFSWNRNLAPPDEKLLYWDYNS